MNVKPLFREILLLGAAASIGWSARDPGSVVHAQHGGSSAASSSGASNNLAFQLGGGFEGSLTIYSPADRTLYLYPAVASSNSHINCTYMLHIERAGAPIERENCAIGSLFAH